MQSPWLQNFIIVLEAPFSVSDLFCERMFLLPFFLKSDRAASRGFLLLVIIHNSTFLTVPKVSQQSGNLRLEREIIRAGLARILISLL